MSCDATVETLGKKRRKRSRRRCKGPRYSDLFESKMAGGRRTKDIQRRKRRVKGHRPKQR